MKLLLVGDIGKPHGVAGACYVRRYNSDSPMWRAGTALLTLTADSVPSDGDTIDATPVGELTILSGNEHKAGRYVVRFEGHRGRAAAEALRGLRLAVPLDALEAPGDDEFFHYEIVGWTVETVEGLVVGKVRRVVETYAELLEVVPVGGGVTFFVPLVRAIVTEIDRGGQRVVIDPPEGLVP